MRLKTVRQIQADFFARASGDLSLMAKVFDTLDCVTFNILDADDRIIAYSHSNCVKCNFANRNDIIGRTCHELFPKVDADVYVKRNKLVRQTGRPVITADHAEALLGSAVVGMIEGVTGKDSKDPHTL